MYTINEVNLDNDDLGWKVLRRSQVLNEVGKNLSSVSVPGRHGVLAGVPAFKNASTVTFVMRTPGENLEALYAVFEKNGGTGIMRLTDDATRIGVFELASIAPEGLTAMDELINVTITLRFPTADWRDAVRSTWGIYTVTGSPVSEHIIFDNIGSDISDMDVFVGGNFGNFELKDTGSGSWLKTIKTWPNVANTGLLYLGSTGEVFRSTNANPWVPASGGASDYIDVSGGGGFRITPTWVSDPSARIGKLTLTVTNASGVTFAVRGYNSYALRNGGI